MLYVVRGWATGAAVCPLRLSVATGLLCVAEIQFSNGGLACGSALGTLGKASEGGSSGEVRCPC